MRLVFAILTFALVAGCSDFPDLEASISDRARNADFPQILPLDALLASVPPVQTGLGVGNLPARLANLRARARVLQSRPVVDAPTRARMRAALRRAG